MRGLSVFGVLSFAALACSGTARETSAPDAPGNVDSGGAVDSGARDDAGGEPDDAGSSLAMDGAVEGEDSGADSDAGNACEWGGAPGECMTVTACNALADHSSYANECPGPATIECCIVTPSTADNPPTPAGYVLMQQSQVTADMTTWAVAILDDPTTYPMFSTTTKVFGTQTVLARVEWHPPDFQNSVIHRGVTLYVPA